MPTNNPAVNGSQASMALHPTIRASGVRGFLQWMKSDPTMAKVYQAIAPQLPGLLSNAGFAGTSKKLGSLACCDLSCFEGAAYSNTYCCGSASYSDSVTASAPTDSTNSSSIMNSLTQLLGVGESAALTANQISQSNAVLNAQLAQAAAGRPPLALTVPFGTGYGTTSINGTTLLLIGGGILAVMMLSGKKKSL